MRGQENEKQGSRDGKSKADDENQQASGHSGMSSSHQIRSRITVVCGECKRLKLKCDRRNPCGSCTKRDTVARCIYSTAAAEKVDLHSLNNRLMQVESILAMVTAGQSPPPFQSTYPLAQVAVPSPSSLTRTRQARPKPPLMSPISISLEDHKNIWLSHFLNGLEGDEEGTTSSGVKLEPTGMDNLLRLQDSDLDPTDDPPRGFKPPPGIKLPPRHVYYSQPTQSTAAFSTRSNPTASETLFAFLPTALDRAKYICRAVNADPSLTILTNWESINHAAHFASNSLSGSSTVSSRLPRSSGNIDGAASGGAVSAPVFATLVYVVAIGALDVPESQEGHSNPAYLDELGSQALQIYGEYLLDQHTPHAEHNADRVAFLSASVLQLKFKLLRLRNKFLGMVPLDALRLLFPLVGRLVNLGRGLGLEHQQDETDDELSQVRRLIWWEICFYDAFVSDALGQCSLISPASFTTELLDLRFLTSAEKESFGVDGVTISGEEDGINAMGARSKSSSNTLEYYCLCGLHGPRMDSAFSRLEYRGKAELFVQCRLTWLLQSLRESLSHDNCECCTLNHGSGYTLDQAARVEALVRQVTNELPVALKLHPSPKIDQSREPWMAALAAKMSIVANRIIIATYIPLMRPPLDEKTGELSKARTYAAQPWSSPNRATLEASQNVLSAVELLRRSKNFDQLTLLVAFHPISKGVFDATVICASTGLSNGIGYSASVVKVACDDMLKGLELLPTSGRLSTDMAQIIANIRSCIPHFQTSPLREDLASQHSSQSSALKRKRSVASSPTHSSDLHPSPPNEPLVAPSVTGLVSTRDIEHLPSAPLQRRSRMSTEMLSDTEGSKTNKYPPPVGVRNRGKGGPSWAKKLGRRQTSNNYPEHSLPPDSLGISIPPRPVSDSGNLEPILSPHGSDPYLRMPAQSTPSSNSLPSGSPDHIYRPTSAHPHNEPDLERYKQRRRLSYDETAVSNTAASFDQRSSFGGSLAGASSSYFSLQGSIQGNIQISRPNAEPLYKGHPPSSVDSRTIDERNYQMQQSQTSFTSPQDQQFDGTLNITGALNPTGDTMDKTLSSLEEPSLYPSYVVPDPKSYDGNPAHGDGVPSPMMPVDPGAFSASAQPTNTQWGTAFTPSFPLDDRPAQTHYWNTDNYYQ